MPARPFSALTALERAAALLDRGSFEPIAASPVRSALVAGRGRVGGRSTVVLVTDGQERGGTIGMAEARQFSQAVGVAERSRSNVAICWNTGGVRVQEGSAALAATAAVGVALTQLALQGTPVVSIVSGPRGCFGAPAVVAATGHATIMTADALWGLTGPRLLEAHGTATSDATRAMSAQARQRHAHATRIVADTAAAVRRAVAGFYARPLVRVAARRLLARSVAGTAELVDQLPAGSTQPIASARSRDFFAYSFRRQWHPSGPAFRMAHVHASWGDLSGNPALGIIVGPERSQEGLGVADAHTVLRAVEFAVAHSRATPAPIVTFLFCRGHASTLAEERAGLPRALAECLRGLVVARLLGHPVLCVLGGAAYGAAYLALAAPSHRILAIRGTTVAPMAPRVLAAFQRLHGVRAAPTTPPDLARMIPEIRIVESVVRLPRALADELANARSAASASPPLRRCAVSDSTDRRREESARS